MTENLASFELHLAAAGDAAPELVHLLPAGQRIKARDGRTFVLSDPEAVVTRSRRGVDLPIGCEHANDTPEARKSGPAPAAGRTRELIAKPDGIRGRVE